MDKLIKNLLQGSKKDCARAISIVENRSNGYEKLLKEILPYTGNSYIVGITGPPGVGKSTFTKEIVKEMLKDGYSIGIIAIDPTSHFTKGAILGDRIRMTELTSNNKVFIRSMGSRGSLGGTTNSILSVIKVLEAYGCDYIFIETVGVGQSEIDIVNISDTVAIVLMPGMGDDIQAIKAGIMEIADIFVINKADKDGVSKTKTEIENMLSFKNDWEFRPKVSLAVSNKGEGINEAIDNIKSHKLFLENTNKLINKKAMRDYKEMDDFVHIKLEEMLNKVYKQINIQEKIQQTEDSTLDIYTMAEDIIQSLKK
ncbi:methylmalonyl Co-A mutase-associated GTPase MeaB [Romboutsia lituseburensis]|uniref:methylmalonyl Co-A mutase-associated GTPase MeaB n=1 Tax=Romboutsia lituseburensis TaxID=1537 RepID=UPI00215A96CE|nr:methylmalonyl Co-A mutase-associated GTPase MeaB [Romboutsia lituseburensis]MCR8745803.1 methylmalonyl Co-A mutase-associated GTPase MeaB [Romboutsia lituseburensis]